MKEEVMYKELEKMKKDIERQMKEYDQKMKEFVRSGAMGRLAYYKKHGKKFVGDGCPFFKPKDIE